MQTVIFCNQLASDGHKVAALFHQFSQLQSAKNAIGVEKSKIQCDDYDDNYYEMYYRLLTRKKDTLYTYNVYLDIKDTLSAFKVQRLKEILNVKYGVFRNVQTMSSKESTLL